MSKDWTGNANSVYKCLGSSHHTDKERQREDYYATDPKAAHLLLEVESFGGGGEYGSRLAVRSTSLRSSRREATMCALRILWIDAEMRYSTSSVSKTQSSGMAISSPTHPTNMLWSLSTRLYRLYLRATRWQCFSRFSSWRENLARCFTRSFRPRLSMSVAAASTVPRTESSRRCAKVAVAQLPMRGMYGRKAIEAKQS